MQWRPSARLELQSNSAIHPRGISIQDLALNDEADVAMLAQSIREAHQDSVWMIGQNRGFENTRAEFDESRPDKYAFGVNFSLEEFAFKKLCNQAVHRRPRESEIRSDFSHRLGAFGGSDGTKNGNYPVEWLIPLSHQFLLKVVAL